MFGKMIFSEHYQSMCGNSWRSCSYWSVFSC